MWTIAIVLIVLWMLGLLTSYTMGGIIHVLLLVALLMVAVSLMRRRNV